MSNAKSNQDDTVGDIDTKVELRRKLRKQQRGMLKDIEEGTIGGNVVGISDDKGVNDRNDVLFSGDQQRQAARDGNNRLLKQVKHTRELKLDAEIFYARTKMVVKHLDTLIKPKTYDANKLAASLKQKFGQKCTGGKRAFNWKKLGHEASVCFHSIPPRVTFLAALVGNGSPEPTKKKRRIYQRTSLDESVEEVLVEEGTDNDAERNSSREASFASEMLNMKKALKEKCSAARHAAIHTPEQSGDGDTHETVRPHKGEIDMIPFLVNPKSYTQTIENFMNLSHLLKKGHAGVRKADNGLLYIRSISKREQYKLLQCPNQPPGGNPGGQCTQAVLSLTMKDWRALIQAYGLTGDACLPHRDYGEPDIAMASTVSTDAACEDGKPAAPASTAEAKSPDTRAERDHHKAN